MSNVYVHFSQISFPAPYSVVNFQLESHSLRFREVILSILLYTPIVHIRIITMLLLIVTIACLSHNHDLSLALLYSLDLLNGIRFLKDFWAASPQRSSWRSQRRGSVASPVMFGAVVLVYKCGQEKLNNLYYQMKEQRR